MLHRLFLVTLLALVCISLPTGKTEVRPALAGTPEAPKTEVQPKVLDNRAEILSSYLAQKNSPLQYHAQDFIDAADTYDLDWKLVPAISGVESTFGKHIPAASYNGWGWGVYGNNALGFRSWRDGIFTVSEGLKTKYVDRGLTTPTAMNRIYASSPTWGTKVDFFLTDIQNYAQSYKSPDDIKKSESLVSHTNIEFKTVETSAKINTEVVNFGDNTPKEASDASIVIGELKDLADNN